MKLEKRKEKLDGVSKRFRRKKYFSILLALFTLGVNIFAWFAFSANVGLELEATVASWNVRFRDGVDVLTQDLVIEITKMKPGMDDFNKTITIESNSDVDANFSYHVTSLSILGRSIPITSKADPFQYLRDFYPFSITASSDKTLLSGIDEVEFEVNLVWPYEASTVLYYGQDEAYSFKNDFAYYTKSGTNYNPAAVSDMNYSSLRNNLYLEKDDADTYFGMACGEYEASTGQACVVLGLRLIVEQAL